MFIANMQKFSDNLFYLRKVTNWLVCIILLLNLSALARKQTPATCLSMQISDLKVSEIILATILGRACFDLAQ